MNALEILYKDVMELHRILAREGLEPCINITMTPEFCDQVWLDLEGPVFKTQNGNACGSFFHGHRVTVVPGPGVRLLVRAVNPEIAGWSA